MTRTITVKGVGTATLKPDYVVLTLSIKARDKDYNTAMQKAAYQIERLQVDYNWGEIDVISRTLYDVDNCMPMMASPGARMPDIEPDDINASDTATFVWAIL